jgi:hypothetical protein
MSSESESADEGKKSPGSLVAHDTESQSCQAKTPFDTFGDEFRKFWDELGDWKTRINLAGVVILALYTSVTALQWRTMKQTLFDTRKNFVTDQRAWVATDGFGTGRDVSDGMPIEVAVVLKNSGKTPALNVRHKRVIDLSKTFPGAPWVSAYDDESRTVIAPGATIIFSVRSEPQPIGTAAWFKDGRLDMFITIRIDYDDVFGAHHTTTACMSRKFTESLGYCSDGNYMN